MTLTLQQFKVSIINYIENELLSQLSGFNKFAGYTLATAYTQRASETLTQLLTSTAIAPLDIYSKEDDTVHPDILLSSAREAIDKMGGRLEAFGFVFRKNDIDKLESYLIKNDNISTTIGR